MSVQPQYVTHTLASLAPLLSRLIHKILISMLTVGHQSHTFPPSSFRCALCCCTAHTSGNVLRTALQVADLRKKIEEEQRMLMQWSEERLALAQSLLGLLELHVTQANKDIAAFDGELQVSHASLHSCSFPQHDAASAITQGLTLHTWLSDYRFGMSGFLSIPCPVVV